MKRIILSMMFVSFAFANAQTDNADTSFTEIPFQQALKQSDYSYYVGSQELDGTLYYEPDSLFGYRFEFDVAPEDLTKIPRLAADKDGAQNSRFVLNKHFKMDSKQTARAAVYLGIKTDLNDPAFIEKGCAVIGPVKLQAVILPFLTPFESRRFSKVY